MPMIGIRSLGSANCCVACRKVVEGARAGCGSFAKFEIFLDIPCTYRFAQSACLWLRVPTRNQDLFKDSLDQTHGTDKVVVKRIFTIKIDQQQ